MSATRFPQERSSQGRSGAAGWLDGAKVALEGAGADALLGAAVRACAAAAVTFAVLSAATPASAGQARLTSASAVAGQLSPPGPSHAFHEFAAKVLYANTGQVEGVIDFLESIDAVGARCASQPGRTCTVDVPGLRMDYSKGRYEVSMTPGAGGYAKGSVIARESGGVFEVVDAERWERVKGAWAYDVEGAGRSIGPE